MPIYEYRCERGHTFEVLQSMTDAPVTSCTTCESAVHRVFHPVAVHFKGSGFYTTDYGRKNRPGASPDDSSKKEEPKKEGAAGSDSGSGGKASDKRD